MKLTQEEIRRIARREMRGSTRGGSSYVGGGGVSAAWVDDKFVSKEFFSRIFTIHAEGTDVITPNDTETVIDSIEAKAGLWTEKYVSALGKGTDEGYAAYLSQLGDVNISGVTDGQVLTYNAATGKWIPGDAGATGNFLPLTGGTLTGTLIFSGVATGNWTEGIRINDATDGWTSLTMGGTLDSGTAAGIWSLHTYQGTFYLGHNGSNDATYGLSFTQSGVLNLKTSALTNNGQVVLDQANYPTYVKNIANMGWYLEEGTTVAQAKAWLRDVLNVGAGVGANAAIGASHIVQWDNDSGTYFPSSAYSFMKISGGYEGNTYAQFLLSSHRDFNIGIVGLDAGNWTGIRWIPFKDEVLSLSGGTMANTNVVTNLNADLLDGVHAAGLFTDLSNSGNDISITIGGTNRTLTVGYASTANRASYADRLYRDDSFQAWGQTYWSDGKPNSISGAMSDVTNIDAIVYFDTSNSRLGIGTNTPSNTLHVNGTARVNSLYIGNILITADSSGIYVSNGGLSANTYVTALGQGSQSSNIYLSQLGDVNTSGASNGQALVYRGGTWVPETISSGGGGSYLPLSGGTMTGTIVTPDNDNEGIIPAANNYGQVGSSSRYFFRMYATTYYGTTFVGNLSGKAASASALTSAGRSTLISDNNEFNFLNSSNPSVSASLHFNYKAANGGNTSTAVSEYSFDNGQGTTLVYLNSTGAHAGSDIRRKNVKEYFALAVDDIADAPVIKYTWKDIDDGLHAGSVAQYWQQVLPECVGKHGSGEYLSMNYADIALVSVISLAREVIRLRKEIENLTHNKA